MGLFRLLVLAFVFVSAFANDKCSFDSCDVMDKIDQYDDKRNEFSIDNNLKSGHQALTKELENMGHDVNVATDRPLQTYLIRLQKILQQETAALTQQLTDNVIKIITHKLDDIHANLSQKLEIHESKISNKIDGEIQRITLKLDATQHDREANNTTLLSEEINSFPFDCSEILAAGEHTDGVYFIYPEGHEFSVYCDMTTDGGGWTLFLNRQKQEPQLDFERTWQEYKNGFGSPSGEYWLGNEALHLMTLQKNYSFRADAVGNGSPPITWVEFRIFQVASECNNYRLSLLDYNRNSSMTKDLDYNNGLQFTTIDADNDKQTRHNCAQHRRQGFGGGFWFNKCGYNYPTRPYDRIYFSAWSKTDDSSQRVFSSLQMKFRPRPK